LIDGPLSKRLLPFHRSQLYRKVTINLDQYEAFKQAIESNAILPPLVGSLTLNVKFSKTSQISGREALNGLMTSLPSLKSVALGVSEQDLASNYPQISTFDNNKQLVKFTVECRFYKKEEDEPNRALKASETFDWKIFRRKNRDALRAIDEEEEENDDSNREREDPESETIIELRRSSEMHFGIRYFAYALADVSAQNELFALLKLTPLSQIEIFAFFEATELNQLLSSIGYPASLVHLTLHTVGLSYNTQQNPVFSRFPNLAHLTFGLVSAWTLGKFYESLGLTSLESLHFGPKTPCDVQSLIDLLSVSSNNSKSRLTTLKLLILDNVEAEVPSEEDEAYAHTDDWIFPVWTEECSEEKVTELKRLATSLGIETRGSTFRGSDIVSSAAWERAAEREAWIREMEEEAREDEEYDFEADLEMLHKYHCGCPQEAFNCPRISDLMHEH
jgi:hypothetical protein